VTELGAIPAQPVEKSRGSEAPGEPDQTSIFRWLRDRGLLIYMTAALAAATPFKHERIEAAEIPPGATWMEGIQTLRNGVLYDQVETQGIFYIDNQAHRGKWIFGKEGGTTGVPYVGTDIEGTVERELAANPAHDVTVCTLHTHPLSAGEAMGWLSAEESRNVREGKRNISIPPSGSAAEMDGDISLWHTGTIESVFKKLRQKGITVEAREGVVDAAGITYHRPINDQDMRKIKEEFPEIFPEVEHKRAVFREWEETISPLVENLDIAALDKLHSRTRNALKYLIQGSYSEEEKRQDVKEALLTDMIIGGIESEDVTRLLLADNPKGQKLQYAFKTEILDKRYSDMDILAKARSAFSKASMTVNPEQLTSTEEYTKLREVFALNDVKIRFVPHNQVPYEPPCAGTDDKP
jgi:hypothetical protein